MNDEILDKVLKSELAEDLKNQIYQFCIGVEHMARIVSERNEDQAYKIKDYPDYMERGMNAIIQIMQNYQMSVPTESY